MPVFNSVGEIEAKKQVRMITNTILKSGRALKTLPPINRAFRSWVGTTLPSSPVLLAWTMGCRWFLSTGTALVGTLLGSHSLQIFKHDPSVWGVRVDSTGSIPRRIQLLGEVDHHFVVSVAGWK